MEIFKELSIGGIEKDILIQQLLDSGVQFNKYASVLFNNPLFSPSSQRNSGNQSNHKDLRIAMVATRVDEDQPQCKGRQPAADVL